MRKWTLLTRVALARVWGRLRSPDARRVLLTVIGVALAVGLMTTVTGIALELSAGTTVQSEDVDYWIVPEASGTSSVAVSVSGPKLGQVHTVTERLERDERITYATPVQLEILTVTAGNTSEYVLAVGAIPSETNRTIAGLPTAQLRPGDPYYANGTYNGTWTGEAIVSGAAAEVLKTNRGAKLAIGSGGRRAFRVTQITSGELSSGLGPVPVVVVHLSELQRVTGATTGDQADQILVSTNQPGTKEMLKTVYPRTRVIASSGVAAPEVSIDSLPLAVAISALVAALVVGVLFVATLMGLEITADRRNIATLAAVGISWRSRAFLVTTETVIVSLIGGSAGVILGFIGIMGANYGGTLALGVDAVARFHPVLLVYGLVIAAIIGVVAAPYPVWISYRTDVLEVLEQ